MIKEEKKLSGPDLSKGVPFAEVPPEGMLLGHVANEEVLLVRSGGEIFAVSPHCTHYQGPLAEGLVAGTILRCPWHHARFDLRTGEAVGAPAIDAIGCWEIEQRDGLISVGSKRKRQKSKQNDQTAEEPQKIVIVGGGAAGFAAAEMLRRRGYEGSLVMLSSDEALPCDRPNLSKDYLAGTIPFDYVPLKQERFYAQNNIEIRLGRPVRELDVVNRQAVIAGEAIPYDRLLLATGAEPVRLTIAGADRPHVHTLRSLADCQAIIEGTKSSRRAVVIGASFIGLEVAAALLKRELEVHVVAPDKLPMERILGAEMGTFIRMLHEENGVDFHLENKVVAIEGQAVRLETGATIDADLVVVGIGVRPRLELAEKAGLKIDRGVVVDQFLETSVPGIYAAGDIARWPDSYSGEAIRVEHWVVAERQGQTAALNMIGHRTPFADAPFFWSQHYDVPINYVGHADSWDEITIDGDIMSKDCLLRFKKNARVAAVASIFRDLESLKSELVMEQKKARA